MVCIYTYLLVYKMCVADLRRSICPAEGLGAITLKHTTEMFQVDETSNPMAGLEGRTTLLVSLAAALKQNPEFFGADGRPGNMIGTSPVTFATATAATSCSCVVARLHALIPD